MNAGVILKGTTGEYLTGCAAQRASILHEAERRGRAEADLEWITDAGSRAGAYDAPAVRPFGRSGEADPHRR